ncbi:MAG TPA: hypothetical protein VFQ53_38095 [Kofleriaceae bacterium]|nr:hypothetical protein [Kofleriaceae bacterium]
MRQRWQRYWFRAGGRTSAAVLRIAIGVSVFWMLVRLSDGHASAPWESPHALYRSLGILKLYPGEPGTTFFDILWPIAWASTIAMILGAATRVTTAISFVSALAIACYEYSFAPSWSHDNNAPLLAQLAFLGAYGGDALSLDALWRCWRKRPPPDDRGYLWSVLLVQLALGLMMASAAFSKLVSGGLSLAWVLSDNLRNHILVRFDLNELPRPPLADWIIAEPWRWKLTAALNILAQLSPLIACVLARRALWRALFGALFAIETVALDHVMGFSNYHWLPLAVVFVDWERLIEWLRHRPHAEAPAASVGLGPRLFIVGFLVIDVAIAFWRWPKIDQRLGLYPLSNFPMFASIRAREPYGEHHDYELVEGGFEIVTEPPLHAPAKNWVDHNANALGLHHVRDREELRGVLSYCGQQLREGFPELTPIAVRANLIARRAPAYPEPARFERVELATIAELARDGTLRTAFGTVERTATTWRIRVDAQGLPPVDRLALYLHGTRTDLAATRSAEGFDVAVLSAGWIVARFEVPGEGERWFVVAGR